MVLSMTHLCKYGMAFRREGLRLQVMSVYQSLCKACRLWVDTGNGILNSISGPKGNIMYAIRVVLVAVFATAVIVTDA